MILETENREHFGSPMCEAAFRVFWIFQNQDFGHPEHSKWLDSEIERLEKADKFRELEF